MAENGFFRVGFRGFKKDDVLQYIDEVQRANMQRLNEVDHARQEAEDTVNRQVEQYVNACKHAEELSAKNAELEEQIKNLTALAQAYKKETLQAREREQQLKQELDQKAVAPVADTSVQDAKISGLERALHEAERRSVAQQDTISELQQQLTGARSEAVSKGELEALQQRNNKLEQQNNRYAALIGDVGRFVMDVRSLGQTILDAAYVRAQTCTEQLDAAVSACEQQVSDSRKAADAAKEQLADKRRETGIRLEELIVGLQQAADPAADEAHFF